MNLRNKRIIISKVNQLGDVICTLPLASAIKQLEPSVTIIFLSREYTRALIEHYQDVDEFADWEAMNAEGEANAIKQMAALNADIIIHVMANKPCDKICRVAYKAKIPIRIGSANRLYTLRYCNRFVMIRRSQSRLHETQLDMMFMSALGGKKLYSQAEIIQLRHFRHFPRTAPIIKLLDNDKFNLILHPKTRGEHTEWLPEQFSQLIQMLPIEKFNIFVTGNAVEGEKVRAAMLDPHPHVHNLCGKISLDELLDFIYHADGLVCGSTGPVHIAAAFGIYTLGLYAPIRPFDAGRWGPVGPKAQSLFIDKDCNACAIVGRCQCVTQITPLQVAAVIQRWYQQKFSVAKTVHGIKQ